MNVLRGDPNVRAQIADRTRGQTRPGIRKEGENVILSPRPRDRRPYLESAPVASDAFVNGVEDLPVQEREP
jgi:virulence-associated protein VagC